MFRSERRSVGPMVGLVVALAGLMGCGGGDLGLSGFGLPGPGSCSDVTWVLEGLGAEHISEAPPDELQTATLRVGEVVSLRVDSLFGPNCDESVERVEWVSSRPDVATLSPTGRLAADLRAHGTGEAVVGAELTLLGGERARAELRADPMLGWRRVYAIRVVR